MNEHLNGGQGHRPNLSPEQRRRQARRKAERARQLRRRRIFWLCLLVAFFVLGGAMLIRRLTEPKVPGANSDEIFSPSQAASEGAQPDLPPASDSQAAVPTPAPQQTPAAQDEDEWQMRLVNATNPLPEGYEPPLAEIPKQGGRQFDARALDALKQMLADGNAQGLSLMVCSAYRSVARQDELFSSMQQDYMAQGKSEQEAYRITATIRAPHGCSEHSSGLAADIVTMDYQTLDSGFAKTDAAKWLAAHCAEYGFILRYPPDKQEATGIIYEPWHFRYVGVENAQKIKDSGLCLEEYIEQNG